MSVPFIAREFSAPQADGSVLRVRATGNHVSAVFEALDGPSLRRDLTTTARLTMLAALPVPRWQKRRDEQRARSLGAERARAAKAPPQRQTVGNFTGLCLPIAFPDVPATIAADEIDAFCNQPGYSGFGNNGSVFDYFRDISGDRLHYRTQIAPLYTARQRRNVYSNPNLPYGEGARSLIDEALRHHRDQGLDFSTLTTDAQNAVFAVNAFYAGAVENAPATGLWPHASSLQPLALTHDKVAVDYQISAMGNELTLGVYCHENGHMLCDFPDLYLYERTDVDLSGQSRGVGHYCLMCQGVNADPRNPTQVGAYLKLRAGWGEAVDASAGRHTLATAQPGRFLVHRRNATEYFIIENRLGAGRDAALRSSGLAIWHVDELGSNADPLAAAPGHQHPECALLQIDGLAQLERGINVGDGGDLAAPGAGPVFVDGTACHSRWWDGSASGLQIHSIEASGSDLSFEVALG